MTDRAADKWIPLRHAPLTARLREINTLLAQTVAESLRREALRIERMAKAVRLSAPQKRES